MFNELMQIASYPQFTDIFNEVYIFECNDYWVDYIAWKYLTVKMHVNACESKADHKGGKAIN